MKALVICLLLLVKPGAGFAQGESNSLQTEVDGLAAKIARGEIGRVEIFQIPPRVLTTTRITPEMLERQYYYRLTIRDVRGTVQQNKLVEAIKSTRVQRQDEMTDMRWGIVFYDVGERRVVGLYFDKFGSRGAVDNAAASFKGDLFNWLEDSFSDCFR